MSTTGREPRGEREPTRERNTPLDQDKDGLKVDFFRGDRSKVRPYLVQLKMVFTLNPTKYPTAAKKVIFAAGHLRDQAFSWFEPYITDYLDNPTESEQEEDTRTIFASFASYEAKLKQVFGTVDEERAAARQIQTLKQTGSAAQYYSLFQQISQRLDWDDSAKASAYYMGLKDEVKKKMFPSPPTELQELVNQSIEYDNRLYELRMETKGLQSKSWGGHGNKYGKRSQGGYGDPMDLSVMEHGRPSRPNKPRFDKGPRGSNKERDRRRENNLCYNCGKSGHRARDCDGKPQGLHMMNDDSAGIEGTKADTSMKTQNVENEGTAQKELDEAQGEDQDWEEILREVGWDQTKHDDQYEETQTRLQAEQAYLTTVSDLYSTKTPKPEAKEIEKMKEEARKFEEQYQAAWEQDEEWLNFKTPLAPQEDPSTGSEAATQEQKEAKAKMHTCLSWTACYNDECHTHRSDKEGTGWFPRRPRQASKDQESLSMMNAPENQQGEQDTADDGDLDTLDEESTTDEEDPEPGTVIQGTANGGRTIVVEARRTSLTVITCYWEEVDCNLDCDRGKQHQHVRFNEQVKPKEYVRRIKIPLCQDKSCANQPGVHAHRGEGEQTTEVSVPKAFRKIYFPEEENLDMMWDQDHGIMIVNDITDERADEEFIAASFPCNDITCLYYYTEHQHVYNVDPRYPHIAIKMLTFAAMITEGHICDIQECEWRDALHCHFSKNE
jgi:hypothetical protein